MNKADHIPPTPPSVVAQITRLPDLLQNNQKRIQTLIRNGKLLKRSRHYCPVPGTVLIREYKGVEHRVTVTHDGQFEYQGCVYRSLSRIAREITGSQWSGPVFFGLRKPGGKHKQEGKQ